VSPTTRSRSGPWSNVTTEPQTWHHGFVAVWWTEFNRGRPELDVFIARPD
jgi:hypothetical protein